jgi:hypothetical protein
MPDFDALRGLFGLVGADFRAQRPERRQIVDPQADGQALLARQLPRQTPAHADVAEIVDDVAENVPAWGA